MAGIINFAFGAYGDSAINTSSIGLGAPTKDTALVVGVTSPTVNGITGTVTCKDGLGNALTLLTSLTFGTTICWLFYGFTATSTSQYNVAWTGGNTVNACMVFGSYAVLTGGTPTPGAIRFGNTGTNTGTSQLPNVNANTVASTSWLVAVMGTVAEGNAPVAVLGTLRVFNVNGDPFGTGCDNFLMDINEGPNGAAVEVNLQTGVNEAWVAIGIELQQVTAFPSLALLGVGV